MGRTLLLIYNSCSVRYCGPNEGANMPDHFTLADYHQNDGGGPGVFGRAVTEIPSATAELISEAWDHPGAAIGHAAKTVVEAGVMGTAIGYLVPARGPASIIVGVAL